MRPAADAEAVTVTAELCARARRRARQPREAAARPLQPDPERDPPHAARRQRHRACRVEIGDAIEIEVADTGTGIAGEHRARVFEPFYRADGARHAPSGAGPRPRGLARDRRGPRRVDLAGGRDRRHARALPPAGEQPGAGARVTHRLRGRQCRTLRALEMRHESRCLRPDERCRRQRGRRLQAFGGRFAVPVGALQHRRTRDRCAASSLAELDRPQRRRPLAARGQRGQRRAVAVRGEAGRARAHRPRRFGRQPADERRDQRHPRLRAQQRHPEPRGVQGRRRPAGRARGLGPAR